MGKKILVADDSATIQKVIKLALSSEGYDILAVSDGNDALKAIEQEKPDAVLVDMALPTLDAFALKRACNQNSEIKTAFILMVSAFEKVDETMVNEVGFSGRLVKPFDPSHLRKVITSAFNTAAPAVPAPAPVKTSTPPPSLAVMDFGGSAESVGAIATGETQESSTDAPPPSPIEFNLFTEAGEETLPESTRSIIRDLPPLEDAHPVLEEKKAEKEIENDIRGLTATTIEMSKLDEFDWNLEDSKNMKQPPPPPKALMDKAAPVTPLFPNASNSLVPEKPFDDGNASFMRFIEGGTKEIHVEKDLPKIQVEAPKEIVKEAAAKPVAAVKDIMNTSAVSRADIEAMIKREIEAMFAKLAKEEVPRIAETVIRKELERILSEP